MLLDQVLNSREKMEAKLATWIDAQKAKLESMPDDKFCDYKK